MNLLLVLLVLLAGMTSCTQLQPEKATVRGSIWLVSQDDVHQAISAARLGDRNFSQAQVDEVVVDSRSEMFVYFRRSEYPVCAVVRRVDGKWHFIAVGATVIVT